MNFFKILGIATQFTGVIGHAVEALSDGKLTPEEIADGIDKGLDAAGVEGIDHHDINVEDREDGGFAVVFSKKIKDKLTVEFN